jgi:APA family basic amino acid/polyamine antiporter
VVGAGIFVITGIQAREVAGPAIVLPYVAAGFSSMFSVFIYTEFALEVPTAGKPNRDLQLYHHLPPLP